MGRRDMAPEIRIAHECDRLLTRTLTAVEDLLATLPNDAARTRVRSFLAAHFPLFMAPPAPGDAS